MGFDIVSFDNSLTDFERNCECLEEDMLDWLNTSDLNAWLADFYYLFMKSADCCSLLMVCARTIDERGISTVYRSRA